MPTIDHDTRPNILWIVSEDCPPWFGGYGDAISVTPNLDALISRGIMYSQAFSDAPVCAPSRFGLLTGVSALEHAPANGMRANAILPAGLTTYPQALRAAGYYCTNNAKTDYNADVDPLEVWDESSASAHWRNRPDGTPFLSVFNFDGTHESSLFGFFGPAPDVVSRSEVTVPPYLPDTDEIRGDIARHYGHIARMDAFVGELLQQLEEDGLSDNTVIIHTSDHGGVTPRSKRYCFDEGLRVPLILVPTRAVGERLPAGGSQVTAPVSTLTLPATVLDIAGLPQPPQMRDLSLLGRDHDIESDRAYGFRDRMDERFDTVRTVRTSRFRFTRNYTPHRPYIQHQGFAWLAAGYRSWESEHLAGRLTAEQDRYWQDKPSVELYDLRQDPHELNNLAGDPAYRQLEAELGEALHQRALQIGDLGFASEFRAETGLIPAEYPLERVLEIAQLSLAPSTPVDDLLALLADGSPSVRRWAAIGLLRATDRITPEDQMRVAQSLKDTFTNDDPDVAIPAAEAHARLTGVGAGSTALGTLIAPEHHHLIRLEALNALTYLGVAHAAPFAEDVRTASIDDDEYIRNAGRYLVAQLDGDYTPETPVFDVPRMIADARRAAQPA